MPALAEQCCLQNPGLWGPISPEQLLPSFSSPMHNPSVARLTLFRDSPYCLLQERQHHSGGVTTSRDTPMSLLAPVRLLGNLHWTVTSHREAGPYWLPHQWRGRGWPLLFQ